MAAKGRKQVEKISGSPLQKLLALAQEHNLEHYRCLVRRRKPDGTMKIIKTYKHLKPEEIDHMVDWIPEMYGGGDFEVEITHPMDPQQRWYNWGFEAEGDPVEPQRKGSTPVSGIDQSLQGAQAQQQYPPWNPPQQHAPMAQQGPPRPGMPPGSPLAGYAPPGMPQYNPWGYQRPQATPQSTGPSARERALEQEMAALRKQNEDMLRNLQDQRHQEELRRQREESDRQFRELKTSMDQQIQLLKNELTQNRNRPDDGGGMKDLFNIFMKSQEANQTMLTSLMKRDSESAKDQLKHMQSQMEKDLEFRKEMYQMAMDQKDPSQAAAMLDVMGQQTASMLNLINQAVSSGLLGQADGDPAWLRAVQQGLQGLQEFGQNFLTAKQQEAAMAQLRQPPQPGAPRFPPQRPGAPPQQGPPMPGQAPAAPAMPPQGPQAPTAVPGMQAAGLGQPPAQAQQQEQEPEDEEEYEEGGAPQAPPSLIVPIQKYEEGGAPQAPPSLIIPIQRFTSAIADGAPPEIVADLIYSFVDFLRANDMLPPEWRNVYTDPADTIDKFLQAFVPHIQPTRDYLTEVGGYFLENEREYGPDSEDGSPGPSAKLQVVDSPTPPASPDEEEPEVQEVEAKEKVIEEEETESDKPDPDIEPPSPLEPPKDESPQPPASE